MRKGANVTVDIQISFKDSIFGMEKNSLLAVARKSSWSRFPLESRAAKDFVSQEKVKKGKSIQAEKKDHRAILLFESGLKNITISARRVSTWS